MKKLGKIFTLLAAFVFAFSTFGTTGLAVQASESDPIETDEVANYEEVKQELAEELEFYFSEVGYVNENGEYIVTDLEALDQDFSNHGIELIVEYEIQNDIVTNSTTDYVLCVVANSLPFPFTGTAYELGVALAEDGSFVDALTQYNFDLAAELLMDLAGEVLTDELLSEFTNISIATNIAVALVSCGLD